MENLPVTTEQRKAQRRYQWTLVLFALVAAATVIWFQRHIEPFITETLIVGGTISLWGLWKLVWSQFESGGGDSQQDLTRRFLGTTAATRALYFAAGIIALLHLTTSSIYLRVSGAAPGENGFEVQVIEDGRVVMGPLQLTPGETVGNPIVPSLQARRLTYQITSPRGFLPLDRELPPWGAHDVSVPGSFQRKVLHLVVLVPDKALFADLPDRSEAGGVRYYLEVTTGGRTASIDDYVKALTVTGGSAEDLPSSATVARDARVREVMNDYYAQAQLREPAEVVGKLLSDEVQRLASAEFAAGATIEASVGTWQEIDGMRTKERVVNCKFVVPTDRDIHTFIIGVTREGACS